MESEQSGKFDRGAADEIDKDEDLVIIEPRSNRFRYRADVHRIKGNLEFFERCGNEAYLIVQRLFCYAL